MILDANTILSANQSLAIAAPGAVSQGILDLTGQGVGNPPANAFGTATVFGEDIGIGDGASPPLIVCIIGTTFTTGTAGTLRVQLQAAVDDGTGNPGTWDTIVQSDDYAVGVLTAGTKIAEFTVPPRAPGQAFPRFYRLNYLIANAFTAGTIAFAGIDTGRDDYPAYPAAY
jgi:hypothetical protein